MAVIGVDAVDGPGVAVLVEESALAVKRDQQPLPHLDGPHAINGPGIDTLDTILNGGMERLDQHMPVAIDKGELTIPKNLKDGVVHLVDQVAEAGHYFTSLMTARGRVQMCSGFDCASPAMPLLNGMASCLA
ncbi:hypothetical protein D3C81_1200740 [compost metagenome]